MAMSVGAAEQGAPMMEINTTPLIDVMLVLLVIFIVTAPLLTHAVKIELPRASSNPASTRDETVQLGMRANGELFWNGAAMEVTNDKDANAYVRRTYREGWGT